MRTDSRSVCDHMVTKFSGMGRFTHPWSSADARFVRARAPLINKNVDDKNARRQTHAQLLKQINFYYKKGTSGKLIAVFTRDKNFQLIVVICLVFLFLPHIKHDVKIVCRMWHSFLISSQYIKWLFGRPNSLKICSY